MYDSADISVVIPAYNRAHCIQRAVDSALAQSLPCRRIIVVDDGSTDDTAKVLAAYGNRIDVIRQANAGVSAARNAGVAAARSTWIAFLDSDDEWEPNKLMVQAEELRSKPSAVLHGCNGLVHLSDVEPPVNFFGTRDRSAGIAASIEVGAPLAWALDTVLMTPGLVIRKDAILRVGGFDQGLNMFEDLDLLCRLSMEGTWIINPQPLFRVHRAGPAGQSLSEQCSAKRGHANRSLIRVYEKASVLKGQSREERRNVLRRLSAQRADLAAIERDPWGFAKSIRDCPSPTSLVRGFVGMVSGQRGIGWLRGARGRTGTPGFTR